MLLQQLFPAKTSENLALKWAECDGNMDAAIDELFAEDMLATSPPHRGGGLDLSVLEKGMSPKSTKPRKAKPPKPGPVTVSLTDQRSPHHIFYDARKSRRPPKRADAVRDVSSEGLDDATYARRLHNAELDAAEAASTPVADQQWLLASSTLSQLSVLLGLPMTRMQSLFNQSSFNLHVAMGRAIELAAADPGSELLERTPEWDTMVETLTSITGKPLRDVRRSLLAVRGQQDAALDLLELQDVVTQAADNGDHRPDLLDPSAKVRDVDHLSAEVASMAVTQRKKVTGGAPRWLSSDSHTYAGRASHAPRVPGMDAASRASQLSGQAITVLPASAGHVELPESAAVDEGGTYTREESLARAAEYRARRDAALQQASRSARQSRATGVGGAAMVYAQEARKHDAAARRWQLRAAAALVEQRRQEDVHRRVGGQVASERIDLHGLTVHEALTVVSQALARWHAQDPAASDAHARLPLEIVTGRGLHSRHHVSVVRPAVIRYLTQRNLRVDSTSDDGVLFVKAR